VTIFASKFRTRHGVAAALAAVTLVLGAGLAHALPITTHEGVLPYGTDLNQETLDQPTELFASEEAGGKRSYLLNLGDMLFSSPSLFGGKARQAGMSCETCHQQGANNAKLYVPGLSSRPGTFDTTNSFFNAKADDGVFNPVTVPSLRGARYLAPYGHDGRFASLPQFIRNVIVNEFAGPEPSATELDALVTYVRDIAFLPNPKLKAGGELALGVSPAVMRGEKLFHKPFPHDASLSCAGCHQPSSAFSDHRVHDIGTGGWYKTPTLMNADFNAPYFHDGRFDNYGQVVAYFDKQFDLGLSQQDQSDLVAYLQTVGDGEHPYTPDTVQAELDELNNFGSVLDTAIPEHNKKVVLMTIDTVGNEWRELGESFPERSDTSVSGGEEERYQARGAVKDLVLDLRRIAMAVNASDYRRAASSYADYRKNVATAAPVLKAAEPWSLFNPDIRAAHFAALKQLADLAKQ
jgi:cytochrome c peroxidase